MVPTKSKEKVVKGFTENQEKLIERIKEHSSVRVKSDSLRAARQLEKRGLVEVYVTTDWHGREFRAASFTHKGNLQFFPEQFNIGSTYVDPDGSVLEVVLDEGDSEWLLIRYKGKDLYVVDPRQVEQINTWADGSAERAYNMFKGGELC